MRIIAWSSYVGSSDLVEGDIASAGVSSRELPSDSDAARAKAFVDFQNDVTAKDIRLAVREGFRSIEHIKRYTTTGMATDQRSEEHTSELQSLMRISYAVFCLKKTTTSIHNDRAK